MLVIKKMTRFLQPTWKKQVGNNISYEEYTNTRLTFLQTRCFISLIQDLQILDVNTVKYKKTKDLVELATAMYNAPIASEICLNMLIDLRNEYYSENHAHHPSECDANKNICEYSYFS